MEMRRMKNPEIKTSLLGFGCMRFPTLENGDINEPEAEKMLLTAMERGVNYIDTAYPYHGGKSEPFVGRVLQKRERNSFYLATKLPCWEVQTKEDAVRIFNEQLKRLQTDYIDFYLLHALDGKRFQSMVDCGALDACIDLQKQGKIRNLGFSFHDKYEAFEKILTYRDWDFCQIQLNYMDTEEQAGIKGYELAKERNIPIVVMEPIKGGLLANLPESIVETFRKLDAKASIASWALRFIGSLDNVKAILSGMSSMEQVEDNLSVFESFSVLSSEEERAVESVAKALSARVQNGCTGCRYCMPCPAGVNIPKNFSIWNEYHIYENKDRLLWTWGKDISPEEKAIHCIECGACEAACPQKLPIREHLKRLQKELDCEVTE